jgi:hypothetical protein
VAFVAVEGLLLEVRAVVEAVVEFASVAAVVEEFQSAESAVALYWLHLVSSEGTIPLLLTLE